MPLLEVSGLTKRFSLGRTALFSPRRYLTAIDDFSLTLSRGEIFGLVGESGSGKSTVGLSVLQLHKPDSGSVVFDGTELQSLSSRAMRKMRRRMQMVFQDPFASLNPRMTIRETLREPMIVHGAGAETSDLAERVDNLLVQVGLDPDFAARYPHELSGGQRQRVGIARALSSSPDLIVADEPTSALDVSVRAQIVELLATLRESRDLAILFISHDLAIVGYLADKVGVMYLGRLVEVGPAADVLQRPLHPYSQTLVDATPQIGVTRSATATCVTGDVPSPIDVPKGCAFAARCPIAMEKCRNTRPALLPVSKYRSAACFAVPAADSVEP